MRPKKDEYYLSLAYEVSKRGTCKKTCYGAIIVKDDQIVSTGYCGAPRGAPNCYDLEDCPRVLQQIPSGQRYELCKSVHAEMNAIVNAARAGVSVLGGTMYLAGRKLSTEKKSPNPCRMCKRAIINAGIVSVVYSSNNSEIRIIDINEWLSNPEEL